MFLHGYFADSIHFFRRLHTSIEKEQTLSPLSIIETRLPKDEQTDRERE